MKAWILERRFECVLYITYFGFLPNCGAVLGCMMHAVPHSLPLTVCPLATHSSPFVTWDPPNIAF